MKVTRNAILEESRRVFGSTAPSIQPDRTFHGYPRLWETKSGRDHWQCHVQPSKGLTVYWEAKGRMQARRAAFEALSRLARRPTSDAAVHLPA